MTPRPHALVHVCAAVLAAGCLGATLWHGVAERGAALAFGVLVAVGELTRHHGPRRPRDGRQPGEGAAPGAGTQPRDGPRVRQAAPLAAAGSLAYALLGEAGGRPSHHGAAQAVAVVLAASLLGSVPHIGRGHGPTRDRLARRTLTVGFVAVCFQPLYGRGTFDGWGGPAYALLLLALLSLSALCDAVLAAALARSRTGWPFPPVLRDELRALPGIGAAVAATGAVMALGVAAVGLWALPLLSVPLLLAQLSYRRYAAVRATYRQTIASLARATEIAGCTPAGHARRVADLSRSVGRDLGLTEPDLVVLEYAALMHDIGQLSLVDPVPAGATAALPATEQRRIALLGGAVVRQTGVDPRVAGIVERQAEPHREQPLAARIVRVVNAYDERSRAGGPGGPLAALEELRLGTAGEYAPQVVESLARVLSRAKVRVREQADGYDDGGGRS
ncbi:HD-GYP domain-containing protein [Streptomyces sp. NPDC058625]|uniref:HD-GYP domain-containing protein n=1 Tax=Streptomyces sp. NPDC058625 TaxID=3346564 RepID=UPI00364DDCED